MPRPAPPLRKEGPDKVSGRALYIDDLSLPGMLHGATLRSPIARGRLKGLRFGKGVPWEEFTIVTAGDIPGQNRVALIVEDQPFLASELISHPEEPVALLAHPDKQLLAKARALVRVEVEPLPAVFTIEDSLSKKAVVWGEDNVLKSLRIEKGDVEKALGAPEAILVEGEYHTGAQEQLYIETNGVIAEYDPEGGVRVRGSMQCPYYVQKALKALFGLPDEKVRVIQTETGGGFGGKEEYPSLIAAHAALLAFKSGKPVKIVYDRAEDMAATTKRHPSRTRLCAAVGKDGKLLALDADFVLDGGAYVTLSPVVLSRGSLHAAGPYAWPSARVLGRAVATSAPPHGAFRGFGAPQSLFALERHMDRAAKAVGLSPEEFRRRNFVSDGRTLATGQVVRDGVDMGRLLDRALELSRYREKRRRFARENPKSKILRGMGLATFLHGAGFTGSGETHLASVAAVEALPGGRLRVLASSTEIGQGTNTLFAQIAARTLGLRCSDVEVARPDTALVPDSGPTVASRTCMVVGKLVERACLDLARTLREAGLLGASFSRPRFQAACRAYLKTRGPLKASSRYRRPEEVRWDEEAYRGDAYPTYAWAAYVAEVSVDTVTYEARVEDFTAVQEVGRVLHPVLAAGQIQGGVAQGIGYALYEKVSWREGRMANAQMTNYIMPTSADIPPIRVAFEEKPCPYGPSGAKGIGELPMDGPAPAILNAVEDATGISFSHIPLLPEDIEAGLRAGRGSSRNGR